MLNPNGPGQTAIERSTKILPWQQTFIFVGTAALIYLLRASHYLFQPQLYAEDGAVWLADAYNLGLKSLVLPYNAFFHSAERSVGYLIAFLPLQYAPLIFNLVAWLIFSLLVYYLFSPRTKILTDSYQQIFVLLSIGLIANVDEFFFNFSNSVFLLGIVGLLILIADEPRSTFAKVFEKCIFVISCFTLVFAWLYLPIALVEKFKYSRRVGFYLYCAIAGSVAQLVSYLLSHAMRSSITFKDLLSKYMLLEIYNQIVVPAVRFTRLDLSVKTNGLYEPVIAAVAIGLCLLALTCVIKISNKSVRYLLFFFAAMTAASLKNPLVNTAEPIKFMATAPWGDRYFIFGIIGLGITLSKVSFRILTAQRRYWLMAIFFLFGLTTSWHYRSFFIQKNFQDYRSRYAEGMGQLNSGAIEVTIPINPDWRMVLRQKLPNRSDSIK